MVVAITWREAYRRIRKRGIDAVVVDSFDPRIGYEQLAGSVRGLPDAPPIVLVSSSPAAAALSAEIGASVWLPKPCELRALLEVVDQLVGDETANDEFRRESPTAEIELTSARDRLA